MVSAKLFRYFVFVFIVIIVIWKCWPTFSVQAVYRRHFRQWICAKRISYANVFISLSTFYIECILVWNKKCRDEYWKIDIELVATILTEWVLCTKWWDRERKKREEKKKKYYWLFKSTQRLNDGNRGKNETVQLVALEQCLQIWLFFSTLFLSHLLLCHIF